MKHKIVVPSVMAQIQQTVTQFDFETWLQENFGIAYTMPVQAGICFFTGFLLGFIFKRYFKLMFVSLMVAGFLLVLGEQLELVSINWNAVYGTTDWFKQTDVRSMISQTIDWMGNNVVPFVSSMIGFLLGCKVG